jgi:hypothetical protein
MAIEDLLISTTENVNGLAVRMGSLGRWGQALSLLALLWILVQAINFLVVFKRVKGLSKKIQ